MSSSKSVCRIVTAPAAGPLLGSFSQGVIAGQTLFSSGAIGLDPKTGQFAGDGVDDQIRQVVLENLDEVLKDAGASYKNVVKVNVFLQDLNDFAAMNEVYSEFFTDRQLVRTTVQVAGLSK
ncbi:unnamed protein product, partial [Rotaria sordida]